MPEGSEIVAESEKRPTLADKLNSRKFIIALIGMLVNAVLMILGKLPVNDGMWGLFLWGGGFMFAEAGVDGFSALGKALSGTGIVDKVLPIIEDFKKLRDELKKANNNGGGK